MWQQMLFETVRFVRRCARVRGADGVVAMAVVARIFLLVGRVGFRRRIVVFGEVGNETGSGASVVIGMLDPKLTHLIDI